MERVVAARIDGRGKGFAHLLRTPDPQRVGHQLSPRCEARIACGSRAVRNADEEPRVVQSEPRAPGLFVARSGRWYCPNCARKTHL
jgi:hypothetical protein